MNAHRAAQSKAQEAAVLLRRARTLFSEAADLELQALDSVDQTAKPRTFGILAVSAVALLYKAGRSADVVRHGRDLLSNPNIDALARVHLAELVEDPVCPWG